MLVQVSAFRPAPELVGVIAVKVPALNVYEQVEPVERPFHLVPGEALAHASEEVERSQRPDTVQELGLTPHSYRRQVI